MKIKSVAKDTPEGVEYRRLEQGRVYRSSVSGHIYLCLGKQTGMVHMSDNILKTASSFGPSVRFVELDAELVIKE